MGNRKFCNKIKWEEINLNQQQKQNKKHRLQYHEHISSWEALQQWATVDSGHFWLSWSCGNANLSCPNSEPGALGMLKKNIADTHSREMWGSDVSGSNFRHSPLQLSHWSHTLPYPFVLCWHQNGSPQGSVLPARVLCYITALYLLNTLGKQPVIQKWVIYLKDFLLRHHFILPTTRRNRANTHPDRQHLKKFFYVKHLPSPSSQSNHWPLATAFVLML